jgi:hypothetical protein
MNFKKFKKKYNISNIEEEPQEEFDEFADFLHKSSIPIFCKVDKKFEIIGTGFLLKLKDNLFLITAKHIFEQFLEIYSFDGLSFFQIIGLVNFPIINQKEISSGESEPDIAVIKLNTETLDKILIKYKYFNEDIISRIIDIEDSIFFIAGFLNSKSRFLVSERRLYLELFSQEVKFKEYNNEIIFSTQGLERNENSFPALNGLSGSAIYQVNLTNKKLSIIGIGKSYTFYDKKHNFEVNSELAFIVIDFIKKMILI